MASRKQLGPSLKDSLLLREGEPSLARNLDSTAVDGGRCQRCLSTGDSAICHSGQQPPLSIRQTKLRLSNSRP